MRFMADIMAQNNSINDNDDVKPTIFHDFLGRGCAPITKCAAAAGDVAGGASPSASVSGGGGPISTTSDLGSERHFEGVPFYGQRSEISEIGNRYVGSKRNNSDSVFMGSSRAQTRQDYPESSHLMKMLRSVGSDRSRRAHDEEPFMRPTSNSLMVQPGKADANASKWERAIPLNVGPVLPYPPRASQVVPYGYQAISSRFKDGNVGGSSVISQSAADEGSRTGIKGSGILSSVNVGGPVAEPSAAKPKSSISEPGSSSPLRRQGSASASRQMTIFYGGQAHVFDDVHPNKADVIVALAGSNGGSWSTNYSPNLAVKPSGGAAPVSGENDTAMAAGNSPLQIRDIRGRLYAHGHGLGSNDRMSMLPGGQGSILMKEATGSMEGGGEPNTSTDEKKQ